MKAAALTQSVALVFGVLALLVSIVCATALGASALPFDRTAAILWSLVSGSTSFEAWERVIVLDVRLPRVLLAAVGGAALATSGAVMQALFRNPMADPGIIGVSSGAALGAVCALYLSTVSLAFYLVPLAAFAGGLLAAFSVYTIATRRGRTPVTTLLLTGVAVSGIASAMTSLVLSLSLADWEVGREMLGWLLGGLEGRSWEHLLLAAPVALGGSAWLMIYGRDLNVLLTGEESALALGIDVVRLKRQTLILSSLVTAAAVAVMGVVGFVGLMIPHIVRLVVGPDHRRLIPVAFFSGATCLVWADLLCRSFPSTDLRLGVVTSLAGGPFFLYLLLRHRRRGSAGAFDPDAG
ncbi:MAG: iron chelate uptake ABC transporter family permease subunit [Myxococcota bacterium]